MSNAPVDVIYQVSAKQTAEMIYAMLTNVPYLEQLGILIPDAKFKKWAQERANNIASALIGATIK
jgi:hypothetical protein